MVPTFIDPTMPLKSILPQRNGRGDLLPRSSGVYPFQAFLHAVLGHVGAGEHAHHVDVM